MSKGFIKLKRSDATWELLQDPKAFVLLTLIALRAKRTGDFNIYQLKIGQALIGDYKACGLTRKEYRNAKGRLKRHGLADFRATNKGTIATLLDNSIYDINEEVSGPAKGNHTTNQGPAEGDQEATNKNEKKGKNEKKERIHAPSAEAERLATLLLDLLRQRKPDFRQPNLARWARDIDRLIRLDGRDPQRIEAVVRFSQRDPFWQNNILSPDKLRKHFDRLEMQMGPPTPTESTASRIARLEREGLL